MNKKLKFFLLQSLFIILPISLSASFGEPEKMNDNWKFILEDVQNGHPSTEDYRKNILTNPPCRVTIPKHLESAPHIAE